MSKRNDGGPAFPDSEGQADYTGGMSLRDYFAAKAMNGLCHAGFKYMAGEGHATPEAIAMMKDIGVVAYQLADAMLSARETSHD